MSDFRLKIFCDKIPRKMWYFVYSQYNVELNNKIKDLPEGTRKWNPGKKSWEIKALSLFELIKKYKGCDYVFFDFNGADNKAEFLNIVNKLSDVEIDKKNQLIDLVEKKKHWIKFKEELEVEYEKYSEILHKNLKPNIKLYPYQIAAAMFADKVKNVLLALDMGLGKTISSISLIEMNEDIKKVVVITPNSLKFNYYNEIQKFTNSKAHIVNWKKNIYSIEESKYIIFNYEYLNSGAKNYAINKYNSLKIGKIGALVLDECHRIKSLKSNSYKNFKKIFKNDLFENNIERKIFMSGTPMPSRASELYSVLNQISPLDFPTQKYFYEYYCGMRYSFDGYGWEIDEEQAKYEELFQKISPYIYRKRKFEVLKDLPDKTYQKIVLEMTPKEYEIYEKIEEGVVNEFIQEELNNPLTIMNKLREYTSYLKVQNTRELIDSILECGEKFVAVDFFKRSLNELHEIYPTISGLHTGDAKDTVRAEIVSDFQNENGDIKIFLGSEATTKEGLTLTAASKIGILSIPYTPSTLDQIVDRLARIGQKNAVNAYIFVYKNSIDEYIFDLIENKRVSINQVIDNEKYESNINQSIINDLVAILKEKHKKK
jgi:SWI/SNF-related matrix-associated actin-dependent regulator 1 of chromatin subfamily A